MSKKTNREILNERDAYSRGGQHGAESLWDSNLWSGTGQSPRSHANYTEGEREAYMLDWRESRRDERHGTIR